MEWIRLSAREQRQILTQVSEATNLPENAIEKDWWVTLALQAIFSTQWSGNLVFKGGTSLSKAWGLIERFSEDIDLALDREVLGFPKEFVSNAQITRLRKEASKFITNDFNKSLNEIILRTGIPERLFKLSVQESNVSDRDPQVLELVYHSVLEPDLYIADKVLIEIGARSLREPSSKRSIHSIIGTELPSQSFSGQSFEVEVVDPKRTLLEKAFLLHEEFLQPRDTIKDRLSRHLYDLERLMNTEHCDLALNDHELYHSIIEHRKNFNQIRGLDYSNHVRELIDFVPPSSVVRQWEDDYNKMLKSMIYGEALSFSELLKQLEALRERFRGK